MPRFLFHVQNDTLYARDEEGQEFENLESAKRYGRAAVADLISQEIRDGRRRVNVSLHIDNLDGTELAKVSASAEVHGLD